MPILIYIPTNSAQEFPFINLLVSTFFYSFIVLIISIPNSVRGYLIVVSICIASMISDVKQLCIMYVPVYYLNIFSRKMFLKVLCPLSDWVIFYFSSYMNSLYVLTINSLLNVWFENIFSHFKHSFPFHFIEDFCIYVHQGYWLIIFFSFDIFVCFFYWGDAGLVK